MIIDLSSLLPPPSLLSAGLFTDAFLPLQWLLFFFLPPPSLVVDLAPAALEGIVLSVHPSFVM